MMEALDQILCINNPINTNAAKILMKVPARKPTKEPIAALRACFDSVPLKNTSPINAPRKGPINIPMGIGMKIPKTNPRVVPI